MRSASAPELTKPSLDSACGARAKEGDLTHVEGPSAPTLEVAGFKSGQVYVNRNRSIRFQSLLPLSMGRCKVAGVMLVNFHAG